MRQQIILDVFKAVDETHFRHAKRILRYIKKIMDISMVYNRNKEAEILVGYTDADWANDKNDQYLVTCSR